MGVGTKVCLESIDIDIMGKSEIRENMRLHGEAMQILALTVRNAARYTLESVKRERKEELLRTIRLLHDKNNSILCIDVLLNFVARECPSASIREIYGKLRELVAWGYIFSAVIMVTGEIEADLRDFVGRLEKASQDDQWDVFADLWQSFIEERLNYFYEKFPLWNTPQEAGTKDKIGDYHNE